MESNQAPLALRLVRVQSVGVVDSVYVSLEVKPKLSKPSNVIRVLSLIVATEPAYLPSVVPATPQFAAIGVVQSVPLTAKTPVL